MALYESVIIGRQDLTPGQFETLLEKFIAVIQSFKGEIKKIYSGEKITPSDANKKDPLNIK